MINTPRMATPAKSTKPKQRRTRRTPKPLSNLQAAVERLALAAGVNYDPHTHTPELVLAMATESLETNAFIHRSLWGVFAGSQTTHDLVAHRLPEPVAVCFKRARAEIKTDILAAAQPNKFFYVQSYPCFARIVGDTIETVGGTIRHQVPIFR